MKILLEISKCQRHHKQETSLRGFRGISQQKLEKTYFTHLIKAFDAKCAQLFTKKTFY